MNRIDDLIANHDGDLLLALRDACQQIEELEDELQWLSDELEWTREEGII